MKKQTKSNWQTIVFVTVAAFVFMFLTSHSALAQGKFKVGDRVECDGMQIGKWEKGTILPYGKSDNPDNANYYRVKLDRFESSLEDGSICRFGYTRILNETGKKDDSQKDNLTPKDEPNKTDKAVGKLRVDENNTVLADRELLDSLPPPLLEEFRAGRWLPIVGAGLSMGARNCSPPGMPDWDGLGIAWHLRDG